jgi:excisionase family DNA binding protein
MGARSNLSTGQIDHQYSDAADTKSATTRKVDDQADTDAPGQSAHAIEPITMRVPEACRYIGIGRSTLYALIADGQIEIIKLGCSTLVLTESLKALIAKRRRPRANRAIQNGA